MSHRKPVFLQPSCLNSPEVFSWPLSAAEGKTASFLNSQVSQNKNSVALAFVLMHLQYHLSPSYEAANFLSVYV